MKLIWYRSDKGNFGDDLNPWLWEKLLPGRLDEDEDVLLIGMGTLLETWFLEKLPAESRKIVLGTGGGMEYPPPRLGADYTIFGVRGPLTAQYHNLPAALALTDPAMCLGTMWPRSGAARKGVGFMPHHTTAAMWPWQQTCAALDLVYVDPCAPWETTLNQIDGLEKLVTEAMHGAIVADAFRVPWLPVRISTGSYFGKWDDWASTVRMPVQFVTIPELYDPVFAAGVSSRLRAAVQARLGWVRARSSAHLIGIVQYHLSTCRNSPSFRLSDDKALDEALSRFHGGLDRLTASF